MIRHIRFSIGYYIALAMIPVIEFLTEIINRIADCMDYLAEEE